MEWTIERVQANTYDIEWWKSKRGFSFKVKGLNGFTWWVYLPTQRVYCRSNRIDDYVRSFPCIANDVTGEATLKLIHTMQDCRKREGYMEYPNFNLLEVQRGN